MTKQEFNTCIDWFIDYYNVEMRSVKRDFWYECVKNLNSNFLMEALEQHIKSDHDDRFPSFGKIQLQINKKLPH